MRVSIEKYYMSVARQAAERSTCPRQKVGAVLVSTHGIVSTGYNGSPKGMAHCDDVGCLVDHGHCARVVHAELNCLLNARGDSGHAILFSTHVPCIRCCYAIINYGITTVVYDQPYYDDQCELFGISSQIVLLSLRGIDVRMPQP